MDYIVFFSLAILYFILMIGALTHVQSGKAWWFLTPFWLFMPVILSPKGNRYRIAALLIVVILALLFIVGHFVSQNE